jgi:hypothetical protein
MGVGAYSPSTRTLRWLDPMRPWLAVVLLPLAACSRRTPVDDDRPLAAASTGGIPPAASGARIETDTTAAPGDTSTAAGGGTPQGMYLAPSGRRLVAPRVREEFAVGSSAGLPIEVVKRIVRQNFGRFRLCYENGLRTDPTLAGAVHVRFVIESDGSVGPVSDAGSTLSDAAVVACVQRGFGNLSFPVPSGAPLTVTYSLSFSPAP